MNGLIAIEYPNTVAADEAFADLTRLATSGLLDIDEALIVEVRGGGKVKLHQTGATAGKPTGKGVWGGVIGTLFSTPKAGASRDRGVDDSFARDLGAALDPGHAALVLLVRTERSDEILESLHGKHDGQILRTSLSSEEEARLRAKAKDMTDKYRWQ